MKHNHHSLHLVSFVAITLQLRALYMKKEVLFRTSRFPIQSWKVRHIPYRCFKFRVDRCRNKDTELKNNVPFRLHLV